MSLLSKAEEIKYIILNEVESAEELQDLKDVISIKLDNLKNKEKEKAWEKVVTAIQEYLNNYSIFIETPCDTIDLDSVMAENVFNNLGVINLEEYID